MWEFNLIDELEIQSKTEDLINKMEADYYDWVSQNEVYNLVLSVEKCYDYLEKLNDGSILKFNDKIENTIINLTTKYPNFHFEQQNIDSILDEEELDALQRFQRYTEEKDRVKFKLKLIAKDFEKSILNDLRWLGFDVNKYFSDDYDLYNFIDALKVRNCNKTLNFRLYLEKLQNTINIALKDKVIDKAFHDESEIGSSIEENYLTHPFLLNEKALNLFLLIEENLKDDNKIFYSYVYDFFNFKEITKDHNRFKKRYFKWINQKNRLFGKDEISYQNNSMTSSTKSDNYELMQEEFEELYKMVYKK